jgi:hypothetical protein
MKIFTALMVAGFFDPNDRAYLDLLPLIVIGIIGLRYADHRSRTSAPPRRSSARGRRCSSADPRESVGGDDRRGSAGGADRLVRASPYCGSCDDLLNPGAIRSIGYQVTQANCDAWAASTERIPPRHVGKLEFLPPPY